MRTTPALFLSLSLFALGPACDSKDAKKDAAATKKDAKKDDAAAKKDAAAAKKDDAAAKKDDAAAKKADAGPAEISLPKVGLKADAPGGTKVSDMMGNDMVQGPNLVATVEKGDDKPKTGEEAQKEADMYTPLDPKVEKLEDGYVLTFTNKGAAGTN
ncbi:MAG: hypothetical protein AAGF11_04780 [Myxococcota bacterium]